MAHALKMFGPWCGEHMATGGMQLKIIWQEQTNTEPPVVALMHAHFQYRIT
jgi:hypothetical protein